MSVPSTAGQTITLTDLATDPHPALARLRADAPAAWVPVLGAWLVTGYSLAVQVLRDAKTFTVDDPRFSTAKVVGASMLSLEGGPHARHRGPFSQAFRAEMIQARLAAFTEAEAVRLVSTIAPRGEAELRRAVAGPLAVAVMTQALGLGQIDPVTVLAWYDGIVAAVQASAAAGLAGTQAATGSAAFAELAASLREVISRPGQGSLLAEIAGTEIAGTGAAGTEAAWTETGGAGAGPAGGGPAGGAAAGRLSEAEVISNAAVLMFGGIETTEGMIANAVLHLLTNPAQLEAVLADRGLIPPAVEESLRLEPAAAVVDRYATAGVELGGARIRAGDQVTVSISGANRDPAVFPDPDRFDLTRPNASSHLAFAHGPHFCLGAHLARLEAQVAVGTVLDRLPGIRLAGPSAARGLVFRKPPELRVRWDAGDDDQAG